MSRPPHERKSHEHGDISEKPRFPYITLIAIAAVIVVSLAALFYFSSAKVEVTPNSVSTQVQASFTASQNAADIPFQIVNAQKIATQSVKGNGTKTVNSSASGTLTIYNAQAKAQTLIVNTRFATAAGLIFRIHSGVTVPGGTSAKPGSVNTKVYADKPGDSYNVGPTSFTIPGFAGSPQAKLVYARSSAPMAGGASGNIPSIDAALEAQTKTALVAALAPDLEASIEALVPDGYVLLPGAATTTYQELSPAPSATSGMVDVKEQGSISAVVFPNAALAKAIASSVAALGYQGEPLTLSSVSSLQFATRSSLADPHISSLSFTLAGTAPLVYTIDPSRISAAVSGKTRSAAEVALTNYPEIKRAVIILRPFWRQAFPEDPASISVVVVNP